MCNRIDSCVNKTELPRILYVGVLTRKKQYEKNTSRSIFYVDNVICSLFHVSGKRVLYAARALVAFTCCQVLHVPSDMSPCASLPLQRNQ